MSEKIGSTEFRVITEEKIEPGVFSKLVIAIPEIGLVGLLALRQLVRSLKMRRVGFLVSDPTSVVIRFENKVPQPPIRLFAADDILALIIESPISPALIIPLTKAIINFIDEKEISMPIMLASAPSQARLSRADNEILVIAAPVGEKAINASKNAGLRIINNGTLAGPYAYLLTDRLIKRKSGMVLLSETFPQPIADPASAAQILKFLGKILGKEDQIDVGELLKHAEELKLEMQKLEKATRSKLPHEISELYT
ncbi:MAG: proteasome assembly chaperone family protein [Candidatus Njordarchaeales archaeon]